MFLFDFVVCVLDTVFYIFVGILTADALFSLFVLLAAEIPSVTLFGLQMKKFNKLTGRQVETRPPSEMLQIIIVI